MGRISKTGFSSRGRIRTGGTVSSSQKQTVRRSQTRKSGPQITSAKRTRIVSSSIRRPKISARIIAKKRSIRRQPPGKIIARSRLQKVSSVPQAQAQVTQFGSGSTAIKNVFGLLEQTSSRNAEKREQFKKEGRTGSIFFDSFFDKEFL